MANYIAKHSEINPDLIHTDPAGIAWQELRQMVDKNLNVPSREKVLNILDNTPLWIFNSKGQIVDGRKKQLMELAGGKPWRWMNANLFPELRNAIAVRIYTKNIESSSDSISDRIESESNASEEIESDQSKQSDMSYQSDKTNESEMSDQSESSDQSDMSNVPDLSNSSDLSGEFDKRRPFLMSIKTNLLYDAALVPNLGAEFYLGKNLSLYGDWFYAWWKNDDRHKYWQIYGGDLGLRWWFGRKAHANPLSGHHLGVYGGILIFDFENGGDGYMGGKPGGTLWDRFLVNSGVEYGYSLPIAKRINIDFSIGIGYLGGNYIKYFPFDNDYYREKEYKLHYFGPTKAEISLIWLIGRGYTNKKKGGDQ